MTEPKFHVAFTERQREIVRMALAMVPINPTYNITDQEVADTLKLLFPPLDPAPRVENIPVLLTVGKEAPIGVGRIVGDTLFVQIRAEDIVDRVEHLFQVGAIRELHFGLAFSIARGVMERNHPTTFPTELATRAREVAKRAKTVEAQADILKHEGMSNAEIARVLDIPESTVRTILEED